MIIINTRYPICHDDTVVDITYDHFSFLFLDQVFQIAAASKTPYDSRQANLLLSQILLKRENQKEELQKRKLTFIFLVKSDK